MEISKFNGQTGDVKITKEVINNELTEYAYFYPKPLPTSIILSPDMIKKLNHAYLCLGELKGLTKNIGATLNIFISISKRKEAVLSSRIEGTRISLTDVFMNEAGNKEKIGIMNEIDEVLNYVKCLDFALDRIGRGERLDKDLIMNMHYVLLKGARGSEKISGDYRKVQNWVGHKNTTVKIAEFVPPHQMYVNSLMDYFFEYMEKENDLPRLIKVALMHYYFETIHPFEDGNGRLGRTLMILYLIKLGIIEEPILYLSSYLEKYREDYYSYLMKVRQEGNYLLWLEFFLNGIIQISEETSKRIKSLIEAYKEYRAKLNEIKATSISHILLDEFFENPYGSIPRFQKKLKKNYPLINRGIKTLKELGIITEVTNQKRNKFFVAPRILQIIEKD